MRANKVNILQLLDVLQDIQQRGHKYVVIEIDDSEDNQVVTIHPVVDESPGDPTKFNPDLMD